MSSGMSGSVPSPQTGMDQQLSWEGDRMFNIYIYDYCTKRGFRRTAKELLTEAEIPPESTPPINAKQGLLFEWWSVFWVLFTAKASGTGSEEAMVYIQHQAQQAANRSRQPPPQPNPMGTQPTQPGAPPQGQPMPRNSVNGMPPTQPNRGFMPGMPGSMPNGTNSFGMAGPPGSGPAAPQMNGIPSTSTSAGPSSGQGPPPFQPMMGQNQRPPGPLPGQMPGQRGVPVGAGAPPFQSPTMDFHPGGAPMGQQPQTPQHTHQQPPGMGMQFNRGPPMQPPNGMPGMNPNPNPGQQGPPGQFQQLGRPPSRTATPGQAGMMSHQQSPSMMARQPPMIGAIASEHMVATEVTKIPPQVLQGLKAELGLEGKDINTMTIEDKQRILTAHRQKRPKQPGAQNAAAGPSMLPPQRTASGNAKRNSISPGEEPDMSAASGSSPPDRKRPRRSPMEQHQQPPQQGHAPMPYPQPPGPGQQQPVPGSGPHQQQQGMMRTQNGFPGGPPGSMPMMGMPGSGPPGGGAPMPMNMGMNGMGGMNPMAGLQPGPGPGQGMMPGMNMGGPGREQYRGPQFHMQGRPGGAGGMPGAPMPMGGATSPGADPGNAGFNPQPQQGQVGPPQFNSPGMRPGGNKGMAPPPSPGMSGSKENSQQNGGGGQNKDGNKPDASPRTSTMSSGQTPTGTGTSPPTPAPSSSQQQQQQNPNQPQQQPMQNLAPSPTSLLGPGADMFTADFINGIAGSIDEFDPSMFGRVDGDLNFERDFGQWFSPDVTEGGVVNPLDMK